MSEHPPKVESRSHRLAVYLKHNRYRMLTDLSVITAWIIATTSIFALLALPRWLLYIVIFIGIIIYSRITPTWERPYRSPDLED